MEDRRSHPRYKISFPIECKRLSFSNYFYTVTKDLSLGGARIIINNFCSKDENLKASLNLIKQVFDFKARVAWCKREKFCDRYSAGLEFSKLADFYEKKYLSFLKTIRTFPKSTQQGSDLT